MINNKYIISACLLFFFLSACKKTINESNISKIYVDNSKVEESKDISDWVDEIMIISIQEGKGNLMGDIYKLFISNGKYIIWDRLESRKINLFDKNGNFIKNILKIGAGPNETLQINDCWINNNGELEAYDNALKKVYQFDSLYTLKKVIKFSEYYSFFNIISIPESNNYVGYASFIQNLDEIKPCHIAFLDDKLKIVKKGLFYDKKFQGIIWLSAKNHFYRIKDTLRLLQPYENYVYNIHQSIIEKKYKIIYKENPVPDDVFESIVSKHLSKFKEQDGNPNETSAYIKKYTCFRGDWLESDDYIFIHSWHNKQYVFISCYNKNTGKVEYSAKQLCETCRYKLKLPLLQFYDQESNTFIGVLMGVDLKDHLYEDSKFYKELTIEDSKFYLVHIKLKNEIY